MIEARAQRTKNKGRRTEQQKRCGPKESPPVLGATLAMATGNYSCGKGEGKSSLPDRRWKCARCSATFDDNVILFNCGCQSCGSSQLEIVRLGNSSPSSTSTSTTQQQQHTPPLLRTPSTEVADLINVTRTLARQALTFAGGDVNEACRNLLLCTLDPSGDPPFLVLAKSELSTMGGISKEEAEALLVRFDNDINLCKQELMKGIFDEEILWDVEGREVVKPRVQRNTTVIDCVVCYGSIPVGEGKKKQRRFGNVLWVYFFCFFSHPLFIFSSIPYLIFPCCSSHCFGAMCTCFLYGLPASSCNNMHVGR